MKSTTQPLSWNDLQTEVSRLREENVALRRDYDFACRQIDARDRTSKELAQRIQCALDIVLPRSFQAAYGEDRS